MHPICRFPLELIRDDGEHAEAVAIIAEVLGRDVDARTSVYLDTLILLVNKYEDENHTPGGIDLSPQDAPRAQERGRAAEPADHSEH